MKALLLAVLLGALPSGERLVFLGDSITDGHTLPLLVGQALGEGVFLNAGVAGDTVAGMRKRLERDVLSRKPTLVVLHVGGNDVGHGVTADDYERDVTAISDRLKEAGVPLLLVTCTIMGPNHADAEKKEEEYIRALRRIAAREHYRIAEVRERMNAERARGGDLLEPDQVHLTFEGYRVMARAVLDGLGRKDEVPRQLTLEPMPGIIRDWMIRPEPGEAWTALRLPQPDPVKHWWMDQERRRGFAVELGPAKRYRAISTIRSEKSRDIFLNTGAGLESVALNGKVLWKSEGWTGWHAGKERLPAHLQAGPNTIEIESGSSFFLSVTDDDSW